MSILPLTKIIFSLLNSCNPNNQIPANSPKTNNLDVDPHPYIRIIDTNMYPTQIRNEDGMCTVPYHVVTIEASYKGVLEKDTLDLSFISDFPGSNDSMNQKFSPDRYNDWVNDLMDVYSSR